MILAILISVSISQGFAAEPVKLGLKQALEFALANSPALAASQKNSETRFLQYRNSIAAFLPSLDFDSALGPQGPKVGSKLVGSQLNLTLSETFYDNHTSIIRFGVADRNREMGQIEFHKARDQMAVQVAQAFYEFSNATAQLEVRESQNQILIREFDSASVKYRQGLKTRRDFIRLQTQKQRSELDVISARNAVARSVMELRRVLGAPPESALDFQPIDSDLAKRERPAIPSMPAKLDQTYEQSLAKLQREVNESEVSLANRRYWPEISLAGQVTYQKYDFVNDWFDTAGGPVNASTAGLDTNPWNWSVLLNLKYNLWDWRTRRRDVEIARLQTDARSDSIRGDLLATETRIRNTHLDLQRLSKSFSLNQQLLKVEQESYSMLESDYREGRVQYLDLITALTSLIDARSRLYSSYFELLSLLASYRYFERSAYESLVSRP